MFYIATFPTVGSLLVEKFYGIMSHSYAGMNISLSVKSVTFGVLLGICFGKLWNLCAQATLSRNKKKSDNLIEGIFFSPKKFVCTENCNDARYENNKNLFLPCNGCSYKLLTSILRKAHNHLDICMYLITSDEISNIIIELFRCGVGVRIILDKHMTEDAYGADVVALRKEYVPIKVIKTNNIMHNKFAVIDEEIVLSGSLNWTRQGFFGNYENVIALTDQALAKKFSNYFQFLWDLEDE